jgi:short-subunit dehydrogenase
MGNVTDRKFAVITGASSGIGRELAKECVDHGFDVLMCADDTAIHTSRRRSIRARSRCKRISHAPKASRS